MPYQITFNVSLDCISKEELLMKMKENANYVLVDTIGTYDGNRFKIKGARTIPYPEVVDRRKELESFDEIIFKIVSDYNARLIQLKNGEIDFLEQIQANDYQGLVESSKISTAAVKGREYDYLAWNNIDIHRMIDLRKHRKNLLAIQTNIDCIGENKVVLKDALAYIEDYLNNKFHLRTFYIGIKYHKTLYSYKNYFYLKNILLDLVGGKNLVQWSFYIIRK